jgi:hypothetical protein
MKEKVITMHKKNRLIIILMLLWCLQPGNLAAGNTQHVPSDNRGNANYQRYSYLDGNNVRVSVHNQGLAGQADNRDPNDLLFEWPKNTKRKYIYFVSTWIGGEVVNDEGDKINIVDVSHLRTSPSGNSWSLAPVPGFLNPEHPNKELARSDDETSWPRAADGGWRDKLEDEADIGWVGSWNGYFGKNVKNADLELYYRCSDDLYTRYNYQPDTTDPTRGGLGLLMDVRAFAWTQILINDVVFFINDIKNDGTKRIPRTIFTTWLADLVAGDANDDVLFLDIQTSIAFFTDKDRIGSGDEWVDTKVGIGTVKYIETPGNQYDGIDNDGDADEHTELLNDITGDYTLRTPLFTENDFGATTYQPGDKIVLIDSLTFNRIVTTYPSGGGVVKSLGKLLTLPAEGITLQEDTLFNSYDDDLDGLIDERLSLHFERFNDITNTIRPVRYINYMSFDVEDTLKRGFIVPGLGSEQSYSNVAPMIDESRDDGFDNDRDWDRYQDDLGMDGAENSGDEGEGDGIATSGFGTDLPGEPNIDKTDVSETDLMGVTGAVLYPAASWSSSAYNDKGDMFKFMRPGKFIVPHKAGENDQWVSSGYFPIEPGERQRIAVSVAMDGGGSEIAYDYTNVINKQKQAKIAYEADYRFAQAPLQVSLTAVPGDGKVTLYWDDLAEESVDNFIKRLNISGADEMSHDFEGYRIYRATDAAMLDPLIITDGQGNAIIRKPIAQFDKVDGYFGYHNVAINGLQYWLGNESGLQHSYVDSGLTNGQRYFYAVTAYDYGFPDGNISPTETPIRIAVDVQGNITTGINVVVVHPRKPVAGYLPSEVESFEHNTGTSSSEISIKVVDPRCIKEGHEYELTFEDTLIIGQVLDVLTTQNFTLTDLTDDNEVLIDKSEEFASDYEQPVIDGFQLSFVNEEKVQIDTLRSFWSDPLIYEYQFSPVQFLNIKGVQNPMDYRIVFGEVGLSTSKDTTLGSFKFSSKSVNLKIINLSKNGKNVEFAFYEKHGSDGMYTINPTNANKTDAIYLLEPNSEGKLIWTWQMILNTQPKNGRNPQAGDSLTIYLRKPFLSSDIYRFKMKPEKAENRLANSELRNIRVVPNPYLAAETWEEYNTRSTGTGERKIEFINLPKKCIIRIFNVAGELVAKIEHDAATNPYEDITGLGRISDGQDTGMNNGTASWNLLNRDNLEVAYGIYIYHVEAPGVGERKGTFAIIK